MRNLFAGANHSTRRPDRLLPAVILFLLAFLASGIATLPQYGIGWDEGLGSFFFGERSYFYWITGQEKYLDFDANLASLRNLPLDTYASTFRDYPYEYPALVNAPSAALMHLLSYRLGWMDPVDAFHLLTVLLATGQLAALYGLAAPHFGRPAALTGMVFLGLFPRFWGDMHFNSKDVPALIFFSLAVLALLAWQTRPGWGRALLAGLACGAAIAVKANGYFVPLVFALALVPWRLSPSAWREAARDLWRRAGQFLLIGASAVGVFFFSWPYLVTTFPVGLRSYIGFVRSQGGRDLHTPASLQPLLSVLTTMPEWMLLFMLIGLVFLVIEIPRSNRFAHRLLLFWLLVPVARISLPNMASFDGIRHFMEFIPAAALTAGYGAARLADGIGRGRAQLRAAAWLVVALGIAANSLWIEQRFRGYEHLYYNDLAGGLRGARRLLGANEATDYWATSYRAGLAWVNAHADLGAALQVPIADPLVRIPARIWLRPDLALLRPDDPLPARSAYVMFIHRPGYYNDRARALAAGMKPAYQIDVDGAPILYIYRVAPGAEPPP